MSKENSIIVDCKEGVFFSNGHDRSILCLSAHNSGKIVVTGSADHGLRVYDIINKRFITELYGRDGHSDWVTKCEFLGNGKIVSGSMDGTIKLWNISSKNKITCTTAVAHKSSVSCLQACSITYLGITGGYDGCIQLWNFNRCVSVGALKSHTAPIVSFVWKNSFVCSGDRNGSICIWDINKCNCVFTSKIAHEGAVGDIALLQQTNNSLENSFNSNTFSASSLLLTGGRNDGCLCVYDTRIINKPIIKKHAHGGAINKILCFKSPSTPIICTLSADKTCKFFDIRKITNSSTPDNNTNQLGFVEVSDVIMCATALNNNILCCGCGDGNVYAISIDYMHQQNALENIHKNQTISNPSENPTNILWAYGTNKKGAIHDIKVVSPIDNKQNNHTNFPVNGVVTGGDDGILCYLPLSF